MNLLIFLVLLTLNTEFNCGSSEVLDDGDERILNFGVKENFTSDFEETIDSLETSPQLKETQKYQKNGGDVSYNFLNERQLDTSVMDNTKKQLFSDILNFYPSFYENSGENFQYEELRPYQAPIRRQVNNWKYTDEFLDSGGIPWNFDSYYPRAESQFIPNEYSEDSSYLLDKEQKNTSYLGIPSGYTDHGHQVEQPQYYQKNYYYNYYPLLNDRKYVAPKYEGDEMDIPEEPTKKEKPLGRRVFKKNPCKQYLQFLKYAFKELDKNSEYNYDYSDDYNNAWEEQEAQEIRRVFATQLLGPTLYIDNSGKVAQINNRGDSVQMVEGISPSSKVSIMSKDIIKPIMTPATVENVDSESSTTSTLNQDISNSTISLNVTGRSDFSDEPEQETISSNTTKSFYNSVPTIGTQLIQQWTHMLNRDIYSTTIATDIKEEVTRNEYNNKETPSTLFSQTNTPTYRFLPDEYYNKLNNPLERTKPDPNSNNSNSSVGSSTYWFMKSSTPFPPPRSGIDHIKTKTVVSIEDSAEYGKKEDCNDKMLPCPDTVNITYPLNGYCNRYVSCESGRAIRRTCPEGLHFNIITKSCDFPHNSFCTYTCPEANGYYGIPGDCSGYFICKNYHPEYRMCPPKMHWDIRTNTCTFVQLSSCPLKCTNANEVNPYEGDCKAYVICLNYIPYYHKCPPNTKFDRQSQNCIPDHMSTCKDDSRLLTKTSNTNSLCRDVELKLGTKVWCSYFLPSENEKPYD